MNDLIVGKMISGEYYVRPISWAGIFNKEWQLQSGEVLFKNKKEDACLEYVKRYENRSKLAKLITEYPYLEVIPMVHFEVCCGDDYNRWTGTLGNSMIKEYYFDNDNEGELKYKDMCSEKELEEFEERGIKWNRAIFLFIDLPEIIT